MGFVYDFVILIPKPIQTKNITIASDTVENYKYQFDGILKLGTADNKKPNHRIYWSSIVKSV